VAKNFSLTLRSDTGPIEIGTAIDNPNLLVADANRIVRSLSILKFRGVAIFEILSAGEAYMASVVTISDDFPEGNWNTTFYPQSKGN